MIGVMQNFKRSTNQIRILRAIFALMLSWFIDMIFFFNIQFYRTTLHRATASLVILLAAYTAINKWVSFIVTEIYIQSFFRVTTSLYIHRSSLFLYPSL
jgi:hypothetical protein